MQIFFLLKGIPSLFLINTYLGKANSQGRLDSILIVHYEQWTLISLILEMSRAGFSFIRMAD
jgi:hypothetical protein